MCATGPNTCSAPISSSKHLQPLNILKAGMKYVFDKSGPLAETYAVAGGFLKRIKHLKCPMPKLFCFPHWDQLRQAGRGIKIRDLLPDEHGLVYDCIKGSPRSR